MKNIIFTIIITLFLISCSNNNQKVPILNNIKIDSTLSTEKNLQDNNFLKRVDSIYNLGEEGYFNGINNLKIYYKRFIHDSNSNYKASIVISNGRTEACIKYKEVIYDLYTHNYNVFIIDHRGQGFSDRATKLRELGHINDFDYYIQDLKKFYDNYITHKRNRPIYILSHSMGGAIATTYIEKFPNDFNKIVLISPMFGLNFPIPQIIKPIYFFTHILNKEPKYAIGTNNYQKSLKPFPKNDLTNSKIRYNYLSQIFNKNPKAQLGGPSYKWVLESCNQFDKIFNNIKKINIPILLFSGSNDKIVNTKSHYIFFKKAKESNKNIEAFTLKNAKHEILFEKDSTRNMTLTKIISFFN